MSEGNRIRAPIAVIMGHVDSGKTSLLDKVRKTVVQAREAGGITQHIGASLFPKVTILEVARPISKGMLDLKTPGVLIIDTPGHEAFLTLRTRGASVADIAIVVVDLTKGFQAQTFESIETLKRQKVPFVIAANKLDRIGGWKGKENTPFVHSYKLQDKAVKERLDNKLYEIMGELSRLGLKSERYDKIKNFTKNIAIIPTSATTGEGIADLFTVMAGLTQQYMMDKLTYADKEDGQGVILEVKEEQGLGTTINVILFKGHIKQTDHIVISGRSGPISTKIKSIFQPKPLDEIRDPREKFDKPKLIWASAGMKIIAQNIQEAVAGGSLYVARDAEHAKELEEIVRNELSDLKVDTQDKGILVKTDTLGSLEALTSLMRERGVPIRYANVGDVSRRDVIDASIIATQEPEFGAILAFNVKTPESAVDEAFTQGVPIFSDPIIYRMIDQYMEWMERIVAESSAESLEDLPKPTKIQHIPEYVFKRNKPMVIGVKILSGELRVHDVLINEKNERIGTIHQIKLANEFILKAKKDEEVSIAVRGPTYGRQYKEGMIAYADMRAKHAYTIMTKYQNDLPEAESITLTEMEKFKKRSGLKFWPFTE